MTVPYLGFFHCMCNTYGTWPPGDDRGWRTRHHRVHVEGNYKHPPPPDRDVALLKHSRDSMTRDAVHLPAPVRSLACMRFGEALLFHGAELRELVIDAIHLHAVVNFDRCAAAPASAEREDDLDPRPRWYMGKAKSWSSSQVKKARALEVGAGGLWAGRGKVLPVEGADHLDYLISEYLPEHAKKGGVLWSRLRGDGAVKDPRDGVPGL